MEKPTDTTTLAEARIWLQYLLEKGQVCPCCKQFAKIYKRPIYGTMAKHLINLYWASHIADGAYCHISSFCPKHPGDFAKLVYWGLVEEKPKDEDNTSTRTSGFWKITEKGKQFVLNQISIPSHIRLYDGKLLGTTGQQVTIKDVLGKDFDYDELMQIT